MEAALLWCLGRSAQQGGTWGDHPKLEEAREKGGESLCKAGVSTWWLWFVLGVCGGLNRAVGRSAWGHLWLGQPGAAGGPTAGTGAGDSFCLQVWGPLFPLSS